MGEDEEAFVGQGIEAFAAAYAVAVWATVPADVVALRRTLGITLADIWPNVRAPLGALASMTAAVVAMRSSGLVPDSDVVTLVVLVATGAITYTAVLAALDRPLLERVMRRLRRGGGPPGRKVSPE